MEQWSKYKYFLSLPGNSYSNKVCGLLGLVLGLGSG